MCGDFLLPDSIIDPATIQAYLQTEYRVRSDPAAILTIGVRCPELAALHSAFCSDCSAFITACNPFSQVLDEQPNAARQSALAAELTQRGLRFLDGIGQDPANQFPGEPSFLVFGLKLEAAKILGTRLEQNAIVWSGADAVPQLVLLR